ncbi:membrane protein implicated in regulation of membrane protease activity [Motilibacter peucedani]|uniref:Membrane protein implicated in regulation of membrane protease activity n=1 Tax=Motilibacter peucedani TaxID=598650 RepID=A0A420XPK7_9ACTN|nr:NfeD family protein [Motilibacter peucedani]RKS74114.1 membrane protein implicated in regulation of membrane protease activity [Motilibacter peucedani]
MDGAAVWWLVAAVVLVGVEVLGVELVALMFAGGALAAGVAALLGAPLPVDVVVAALVSLAGLVLLRPVALRHLRPGPEQRTGTAALVGSTATVLARVDDGSGGRVKLNGEVWSARTYLTGTAVEPGRQVQVMSIDGATAVVHEMELPWSP